MKNELASAGQTLSSFPDPEDFQGWVDVWCAEDTGNIDCVAPCLRPYLDGMVTPEGWLKVPCPMFPTPLAYARWSHGHSQPHAPWFGTGMTPQQVKRTWYETIARLEREENPPSNQLEGYPDLYFIRSAGGPIKIGVSNNVPKRLRGLQTSSPYKLELACTVVGGAMQEPEYHALFAEHRLEGEWFSPAPEIEAEIARLTQLEQAA